MRPVMRSMSSLDRDLSILVSVRSLCLAATAAALPMWLAHLATSNWTGALVAAGLGLSAYGLSRIELEAKPRSQLLIAALLVAGACDLYAGHAIGPWLILAVVTAFSSIGPLRAGVLAAGVMLIYWQKPLALSTAESAATAAAFALYAGLIFRHLRAEREAVLAELRRLEREETEAVAASRAKDQLLANVSHEIRTPMGGVIGLVDLLLKEELPAKVRERIEVIDASAEALLVVIDDLLDFSRLSAGKLSLDPVDIRLHDLAQKIASLLRPRAEGKGLELHLEIESDVPEWARADPARLRQVLINLIGNAVKFTDSGSVTVQLRFIQRERLGFSVTDTGIGIREEDRESLFEPFVQADSSASRRHGGAGLGLAISNHLVALMGGRLAVESKRRAGSTFSFEIPYTPPSGPETTEILIHPGPLERRYRVLVVDDNPVNRMVALAHLEHLDFEAIAVDSGQEALDRLHAEAFDIVLMDCQLPGLDGYETTRRLRRSEGDGAHLPVIAVTAHAMKGERERCLAAGMDDYLAKPFRNDELADALERWLGVGAPT